MGGKMLLFEKETYELIGAGVSVHSELTNGYLEAVYQEAFAIELEERGIPYEREKPLHIRYHNRVLDKPYYADFFCYDSIIVEMKAVKALLPEHEAQVLNYLKTTGCRLGLLLNFGTTDFQHKRLVL